MAPEKHRVELDVGLGRETEAAKPAPDAPFTVLLLGDFSGRRGADVSGAAVPFDRDDVDAAIARVAPALTLSSEGGARVELRFRELEDFHPDRLYENVPLFRSLRDLRGRLSDARTFAAAAREVSGETGPGDGGAAAASGGGPAATGGGAGTSAAAAALAGGSLLDRMLDDGPSAGAGAAPPRREDDLAAFVRQVVAPHVAQREDPRQAEMVAGVDAALATQMRTLLHAPPFRALEASWRTVDFLARRIETDGSLRLYLLDLPRATLNAALDAEGGAVALARLLSQSAGAVPGNRWTVIAGLYDFEADDADGLRIAQLGAIAQRLGAALVAGAAPSFAGRDTWAELPDPREWEPPASQTWQAIRGTGEARSVALAAPGFLLRAPYGVEGELTEAFAFEEIGENPGHDDFLWGCGGALCTLLLAQSFADEGWSLRASAGEVRGLPLHVYRRDGASIALPCAETLLTDNAADRLMELGVTPLASLRDSDGVRVVRLQSIASPPTRLAGAWSGGR